MAPDLDGFLKSCIANENEAVRALTALGNLGREKQSYYEDFDKHGRAQMAIGLITMNAILSRRGKHRTVSGNQHLAGEYVNGRYNESTKNWQGKKHNNYLLQFENKKHLWLYNNVHLLSHGDSVAIWTSVT
ncbi:hypothetical protein ACO2FQ_13495 [Lacticaseibacillus paracasei]|uniref:hypothetical protein n=1 Tax=Lacticaseibacillus paracasei TaxID=1597 RepID=UPI0007BF21A7|nr:hypothetical protein [Lacticaseibacillus paracasei]